MLVDRNLLERHARFATDGIEERAFFTDVGSDRCFGILYQPQKPAALGFIVCHSYALEFLTLRRIERAMARTLASLGHPVLALHSRGYGDSTGALADATLDRHHEDVLVAAERLAAETGASELGLIGARFGALRAGMVARSEDVSRLILISPEFSGAGYFRRLIKNKHMVDLTNSEGRVRRSMAELLAVLEEGGTLDLLGYALHGHLYKSLAQVDLAADMGRFSGDALVVQLSKRGTRTRAAESFAAQIEARGGACRLEVIQEPPGVNVGGPAFVMTSDPNVREDLQEPVVDEMSRLVEEWMRE